MRKAPVESVTPCPALRATPSAGTFMSTTRACATGAPVESVTTRPATTAVRVESVPESSPVPVRRRSNERIVVRPASMRTSARRDS